MVTFNVKKSGVLKGPVRAQNLFKFNLQSGVLLLYIALLLIEPYDLYM